MGMDWQPLPAPACGDRDTGWVTLEAEVPEALYRGLRTFLESHPHWDQVSVISCALAGFLFQHGCQDPSVAKHYLDGLFLSPDNSPSHG